MAVDSGCLAFVFRLSSFVFLSTVDSRQSAVSASPRRFVASSSPSAFSILPSTFYGYRPLTPSSTPAVSIITPYYNTGPTFLETVDSVLRQSLQQWEWIIVNDGSDDRRALQTLLPLRNADARIRVIDCPHQGPSAARNAGVAASCAPLLFFIDSDDLLAPTALEKLAWTLISHPESAFATAWTFAFGHENLLWPRGFDTRYAQLYENMISSCLAMVQRQVFKQVGGFDETRTRGLEDYEFWLRCAAHGFWGHDIHEYLLYLRRKPPTAYTSYRWDFNHSPQPERALLHEMRARYPQLFRNGLPSVRKDTGTLLDTHALIENELPFTNRLEHPGGQRRVLMLLPWLRVGGSDRFALDLAAGLTARGDRVSVCLTRSIEHTWLDELGRTTSDIFDLPAFLAPADYPRFLRYLISSREITTVLISHSLLAYQLLPYLRAHYPLLAIVDYQHLEEEAWRHGGMARAGVEHDELLDLHITASHHLADWMIERGATAERTEVCTINIDPEHWSPDPATRAEVRAELSIADDTPLLLFAGRLVPQKRPRLAAQIVRQLHEAGERFVCLVAGDDEEAAWLRRFVRRHRLADTVRLLGAVPHERMRALLSASDVLLLPSANEGIALVLYEALAMGVVPVAADVGGQRELVTPDCGVLIAPGPDEAERYVQAIRHLLHDSTQRIELARTGRERITTHFTQSQMLDRMQMLLNQATERAARDPRPAVSIGAGRAGAALAIEHYQLEERLRRLPPVRLALRLRQSGAWRMLGYLRTLRSALANIDRWMYAMRRETIKRVRKVIGHSRPTG